MRLIRKDSIQPVSYTHLDVYKRQVQKTEGVILVSGCIDAVKCARDFLGDEGQTLILFGDTPLITAETLNRLAEHYKKNGNTVTVLSAMIRCV